MRTLNWKINRIHDVQIVDNKYQFGRLCQEFKLPVLPTIAAFEKGKVADDRDDFSIPKTDIYFKPSNGMKGYGIERWNYNAESDLWIFEHQKTNETELKNRFKEASKREDFIIQEAAYNHPAIEGLSEGGLISFRVITVIGGINDVDLIAAFINIPIGNSHVSQRVHGGILAQLDLDTGRVKSAIKVNPKLQKITHHPQTGVEIAGFVFKEWLQLVALAKKAHKMFPSIFSIGWDLAFTRNGPEILEGNTAWGMTPGVMVGRSNYCRWYLEFLERDKAQGGKLGSLLN